MSKFRRRNTNEEMKRDYQLLIYLRDVAESKWDDIAFILKKDRSTCITNYRRAHEIKTMLTDENLKKLSQTDFPKVAEKVKPEKVEKPIKYASLIFENICVGFSYEEYIRNSDKSTQKRAWLSRKERAACCHY